MSATAGLWGAATLAGLAGCAAHGVGQGGAAVPNGSPEYQAAARQVCDMIHGSHSRVVMIGASRHLETGAGVVVETTIESRGGNARVSASGELTCETRMTISSASRSGGVAIPSSESRVVSRVLLSQVTGVAVGNALDSNPMSEKRRNIGGSAVASTFTDDAWYVVVGGRTGVSDTFVFGKHETPSPRKQIATVASFESKADAERLAAALRKLVELAKKEGR